MSYIKDHYEDTINCLAWEMIDNGCKVDISNSTYITASDWKKREYELRDWLWRNLQWIGSSVETFDIAWSKGKWDDVHLGSTIINGLIVAYENDIYE